MSAARNACLLAAVTLATALLHAPAPGFAQDRRAGALRDGPSRGEHAGLRARAGARAERLPAPAGTRIERDLAYGPAPEQRIDVYLPPAPRDAPVLLMVHGGGWARGDKRSPGVVENKVAHWLPRGWIVVSANNRLLPDAAPLDQARDIAAATAKVQQLAPAWGGDPSRVVLMGHSAGAHLVALLGADPSLLATAGARPVRGVVALDSAVMDVPAVMSLPKLPSLYRNAFGSDPAAWPAVSPRHRLQRGAPPMLSVCSSQRRLSCVQSRQFAAAGAALGVRIEVLPQADSHAGINHSLGLESAYTRAVDAFLDPLVAR